MEDRTSVIKGAVDVKWVLIALLFCAVCAMAGWIIGSNRVESSAPVPVAQIVGGIPQVQQTPQVILVAPEQQSPPTEPASTMLQAGSARALTFSGTSHGAADGSRAHTAVSHEFRVVPAPRSAGGNFIGGTWIQVTASDGSVVFFGPGGQLVANTGDASASGVINIDPAEEPTFPGGAMFSDGGGSVVASGGAKVDLSNADLGALTADIIEGYEDHSLHVTGHGNLVTYDDSNVFVNHTGDVNANTGDTDSGGLIAVDVHDSAITVGSEREESDDDDDDGEEEEESETRPVSNTASGQGGGSQPQSSTPAAVTGDGAVTIGGDGWDDISVHVDGNGNVVTEDDSNVLVGGAGATNAQIGDSDTAGAIVMDATGSQISTGCFGADCVDD